MKSLTGSGITINITNEITDRKWHNYQHNQWNHWQKVMSLTGSDVTVHITNEITDRSDVSINITNEITDRKWCKHQHNQWNQSVTMSIYVSIPLESLIYISHVTKKVRN